MRFHWLLTAGRVHLRWPEPSTFDWLSARALTHQSRGKFYWPWYIDDRAGRAIIRRPVPNAERGKEEGTSDS